MSAAVGNTDAAAAAGVVAQGRPNVSGHMRTFGRGEGRSAAPRGYLSAGPLLCALRTLEQLVARCDRGLARSEARRLLRRCRLYCFSQLSLAHYFACRRRLGVRRRRLNVDRGLARGATLGVGREVGLPISTTAAGASNAACVGDRDDGFDCGVGRGDRRREGPLPPEAVHGFRRSSDSFACSKAPKHSVGNAPTRQATRLENTQALDAILLCHELRQRLGACLPTIRPRALFRGLHFGIIHILFNLSTRLGTQPSPPQAEAEQQ